MTYRVKYTIILKDVRTGDFYESGTESIENILEFVQTYYFVKQNALLFRAAYGVLKSQGYDILQEIAIMCSKSNVLK